MQSLIAVEPHVWRSSYLEQWLADPSNKGKLLPSKFGVRSAPAKDVNFLRPDAVLKARANSRSLDYGQEAYVAVQAFAHDRLTVTTARVAPPLAGKKFSLNRVRASVRGAGILDRPRETRRYYLIGGRRRCLPSVTRLTTHARNFVKDGGHLIERDCKGVGLFLTATVPTENPEVLDMLSAASGYLADRMNRWLRYKCVDGCFVYVWELQERGTPHLHFLLRIPENVRVHDFTVKFQQEWRRVLLDVWQQTGLDPFLRANGETWRDDPRKPFCCVKRLWGGHAQYLAKYLSKTKSKGGSASSWRPGRWTGCSYPLRRRVLANRCSWRVVRPSVNVGLIAARSLSVAIAPACLSRKRLRAGEKYGVKKVSMDCKVGLAKRLAELALGFIEDGDITELRHLVDVKLCGVS
jgi:hypothetical protein